MEMRSFLPSWQVVGGFLAGAFVSTAYFLASWHPSGETGQVAMQETLTCPDPDKGKAERKLLVRKFAQFLSTLDQGQAAGIGIATQGSEAPPEGDAADRVARSYLARSTTAGEGISMSEAPFADLMTDRGRGEWLLNSFMSVNGRPPTDMESREYRRTIRGIYLRVWARVSERELATLTSLKERDPKAAASWMLEIVEGETQAALQRAGMDQGSGMSDVLSQAHAQIALDNLAWVDSRESDRRPAGESEQESEDPESEPESSEDHQTPEQ